MISRTLLELLHSRQHQGWRSIVTLDESWFYFSHQHGQIWLPDDEDPPTNARPVISRPKTMPAVVWNPHRFHVIKALPRGCNWTSQYYIDNILPEIRALHIAADRRKLVIHADNASPRVSTRVKQYMEEYGLSTAPHPSYSPDRAPSDFFLFGYVTRTLQKWEFQTVEELLATVVGIFNAIPTETMSRTFHEWIRRLQTWIDTDGEYVESGLF
jgi:hypothetical protein